MEAESRNLRLFDKDLESLFDARFALHPSPPPPWRKVVGYVEVAVVEFVVVT